MTAKITTREFAIYRICPAVKERFFDRYGLDWDRFVREGMTADELRAPGDRLRLIDRLEAAALAREAK